MEKKRKMENDSMKNWHHTPAPWMLGVCHQVLTRDGRTVADAG